MQTEPLATAEIETQTAVSSMQAAEQLDKNVSTGDEKKAPKATLEGLQYTYNDVDYDADKLASFLESTKDEMLSILYKATKSNAFDNYTPSWSQNNTELTSVYTLASPHAVETELHALSVSWSANGTMIAVGYGRMDTSGWCYSNGYVGIWNLIKPDLDVNVPHFTLQTDTYVTRVAFHPTNSLQLAVGTYSGEVIVFPNVTDTVPVEYSTNASGEGHQEPITNLVWLANLHTLNESERYVLCAAGQDGLVTHWTLANKLAKPAAVHTVRNKRRLAVGVEAMCYAKASANLKGSANISSVDNAILIGLESGDVGRGRTGYLDTEMKTEKAVSAVPLELDWLDGHRGPIQSISASPFFRHLFVTCSSDGSAHLYTDMERSPVAILEPSSETKHFLYDAQFSPFRPCVLALVSRSSFLHLYDLQKSQSKPSYSVEAGVGGASVVSLSFNEASPEYLATGDLRGCVRVFRLPTEVMQATEQERAAIRADQHAAKEKGTKSTTIRDILGFTL
ncbi:WD repeat domain 34 [Strigomonas culicis]|nr:WD repeat domain 34 [Strigomonas culicis]|eukprot:EPY27826.1 WD repeat domain 34 [Strigomonas culicis]